MVPRRGSIALLLTTLALVLLLNFRTPDDVARATNPSLAVAEPTPGTTTTPDAVDPTPGTSTTPDAGDPTLQPSAASPAASDAAEAVTVTGPAVDTRWGAVQVEVTIRDGRIVDVTALQLPTGRHSGDISDRVEPILRAEVLERQSADVDTISGATYTCRAYADSLQAALDAAGFVAA